MLVSAYVGGTCVAVGTFTKGDVGRSWGGVLVQLWLRAIPFGIAAVILGFVLKSVGTQARPADTALPGPRLSVFGTIHPDIFRLSAPLGSESADDRVQLASLGLQVGLFDAPAKAAPILTDKSATACQSEPFEERFAALDDHPAASADDCAATFDERFGLAMRVLASSLRLPPDQDVQNRRADAPPKATVSNVHVRLAQPRNEVPRPSKEVPPLADDGRTAIYDITARTVYLPSGRRLEAHSGFGDLMDNPRHVSVRMQGATPPNVYNLTLRERLFHGVRAIRLNPVDGSKMYSRAGILAHPYMLGPNGQSNGCVSFSDYPEFLNAFLRGEVTRLVVVERLESPPGKFAAGQLPDRGRDELKADRSFQYAAASY
jgi:Tlde1 domain